jgi:hypothetical protein
MLGGVYYQHTPTDDDDAFKSLQKQDSSSTFTMVDTCVSDTSTEKYSSVISSVPLSY